MSNKTFIKPRPYQAEQQQKVIQALKKGDDKLLVTAPTGAGKSWMMSFLLRELFENRKLKVLVLVPKIILVEQLAEPMPGKVTIYNASLGVKDFSGDVVIGSVQSVAVAKNIPKFNILIIDETHRANMEDGQHSKIYKRLKEENPNLKLIGYTATPFNSDGYIYGEEKFWDKPVFEISLEELTNLGYLVPMIYKQTHNDIDISKAKKNKDDYVISDLERIILSDKTKVERIIRDMVKKTVDRKKVIILTTSIKHAEVVYELLPGSNIVHSKRKDRDEQMETFEKSGKYLVSVLVASEGYDFGPVDCIAMMRPTRSPSLYQQAAGRALRLSEGKEDALFLDYGRVVENLGEIYDIDIENKKKKADFKFCINCDVMNKVTAKTCKACKNVFMTECSVCLEMKPYGESCCEQNKRDMLKNLTEKAYESKLIWRNVTQLLVSDYRAKSGSDCYRFDYYSGIFKVHTEYIRTDLHWKIRQFKEKYGETYDRIPKKIALVKDGKYSRIVEEFF